MRPISFRYDRCLLNRVALFACVMILVTAFLPVRACAETGPNTVRVGYYENEVFQEGAEEGAVKTGYAYEYYQKLSEYTGWRYEYVYGSFSELYQMLLDGDIDLLAGLAWREDRVGLIGYPTAVMGNESYYLVRHGEDLEITADPSTLNGRSIGVLDSVMVSVLNEYLESHHVTAEVIPFADYTQLFEAFDAHRTDLLAAESDGAHGRANAEVLNIFGASDYYLCVSIHRPDLLAELNTAQTLLAAEEPNYINTLRAKYYSVSVTARAFSQAEREWMNTHSTLHVGYLDHYLPYSDTDGQGKATGIVKDIVPAILETLGMQDMTVIYSGYTSYDDLVAGVRAGEIDAAFPVGGGLYYSEENGIYQSNPVSSAPAELVYRGEFSEKTTEHFAVNENNRMQYYFIRTNYPEAEISFYPSSEDCLAAVLAGKAGCVTLNGLRANDILRNRQYEDLSLRQTSYSDPRCFGVEIGNEGLLKLLNRGVNVLGSDYAQSISYRYTGGLYTYGFLDFLQDHMLSAGLLLFAAAAAVVLLLIRDIRRTRKDVREKEAARQALEEKNRKLAESQKALSEALTAAEQANRAKTVFLNNMSHDMRTPMNAIVGFTALAASHLDNQEQVRDYLGKISVSSRHLLSLINDVLDMSRIESGKLTIEETDVHLPDVIHDLKTIVQPSADAKQLELIVDMQDVRHEDIVADRLRLNQALLNILSNAIKFTPAGGTIRFWVIEKDPADDQTANFEFHIKDNGIGMSEEFQKVIFEAFTREKTSTVSGIQGTGLGMAITKKIVDMMGGTISVQSREGEGSEFVVALPCRISTGSAAPETPPAPERRDGQAQPLKNDRDGQPGRTNGPDAMPDFTGKRVLLAEDNEMNQMIAENILSSAGFQVDIAADGTEAVEKVRNAPAGTYDLILMDIQMPKMDGHEAARQIRAMEDGRKAGIPIVAVTANVFEEDRKTALEAGMNGHLAKPYDIPTMMKTLQELLK